MLYRLFAFTALLSSLLSVTPASAQSKAQLAALVLANSDTLYGSIIHFDETTVTLRAFWMRDIVIYRTDIAETIASPYTREELFERVQVSIKEDGNSVRTGYIQSATFDTLSFRTLSGLEIDIPQKNIQHISSGTIPLETLPLTEEQPPKQLCWQCDRQFVLPDATMPDAGQFYISSTDIIFISTSIGLADHLSFTAGAPILMIADAYYYFINPKVSLYNTPKTTFSLSYIHFGSLGYIKEDELNLVQILGTFRGEKLSFHFGAGKGVYDVQNTPYSVISAGFSYKLSERSLFMSENVFAFNSTQNAPDYLYFIAGIRLLGKSVSADIAVVTATMTLSSANEWNFIPLLTINLLI